jgi:predicted DNA-binding transcriptional regulator YafY
MAQIETFQRYLQIVQYLLKKPATLKEIQQYLSMQAEQNGLKYALSQRTFLRDKEAILTLFKLDIVYNERDKVYYIEEEAGMESVPARLIEALNTFNALQFNQSIPDAVQLEYRKPRGIEYFRQILQAITQQKELVFSYTKFESDATEKRTIKPYVLKEYKNRWYVIGEDANKQELRTFGLDRMDEVLISTKKFKKDAQFRAEEYFKYAFGVIYNDAKDVEELKIWFDKGTGNYIKTMPLHHSQKIISDNNEGLVISLTLFPNEDFVSEMLSYGAHAKVLSPARLKNAVKTALKKALEQYDT